MKGLVCLLLPVFLCAGGFFASSGIFSLFKMTENSELFKFICAAAGFITGAVISFIISRLEKREVNPENQMTFSKPKKTDR